MNLKYILITFLLTSLITLWADILVLHPSINGNAEPSNKIYLKRLQQIAYENEIKIKFKAIPWKRALLMVEKGLADGVINASYKKSREQYAVYPMLNNKLDYSKRINDGKSYYIYKHKDSKIRWNGKVFLNPDGDIGVMDKYAVIDDLKKHNNITVKTFAENPEIIRCLASKKIAAYAGMANIVDELLNKYPKLAKNIVRESMPIRKKEYFLIFSKKTYTQKNNEMEKIWNGLKKYNRI